MNFEKFNYTNQMKNQFTEDDIRDIAIRIVDKLVLNKYIPDCIDTDDWTEFDVQDLVVDILTESLNTQTK
jgi:hypothetical protein